MSDEVGTIPAFPDLAAPGPDHRRWLCTKCGGDQVSVDLTRPSIDPRYALGYCRTCSPSLKSTKAGEPIHRRATAILREAL